MESIGHPGHGEQTAAGEIAGRAGATTTTLRLLLVEDDPADARLTQALLGQAGVAAQWSCAGKLADVSFGDDGEWVDCALVDLGLPDSQALEVVREISRRAPRLPVVVLSGNSDEVFALRAVREGAQDYLVKGRTDPSLLAKTIRYAIERKKIEHELQQAQQLARLGRLAGGIAHHFNNILAVITNYSDFVAEAFAAPSPGDAAVWQQARDDATQIRQAAQRAADLTHQLTIYAEQDISRPEVIQLNDIVASSQDQLAARLGDEITLDVILAPGLCPVLADPGHIGRLLDCLADNARDAMAAGGKLTISTASAGDPRGGFPERAWARLQVDDTGSGIAADVLESVFDPFFTTKPPGQGVGLGLAVVRAIVTRSGGQLDVTSAPGAGTTVAMLLPGAASPGAPAASRPGARDEVIPAGAGGGRRS